MTSSHHTLVLILPLFIFRGYVFTARMCVGLAGTYGSRASKIGAEGILAISFLIPVSKEFESACMENLGWGGLTRCV